MTWYIQRFGQGHRETVDEFESLEESRKMLREYRLLDGSSAHYYLSRRACANWRPAKESDLEKS